MPAGKAYCGAWRLPDRLPGSTLTVGEAILSPTRTYLPVIREILAGRRRCAYSGLIHCTGGGQAKCRDFGQGIRYVKDNLFPTPPIFQAIRTSGEIGRAEMYQVFNMGHRLEIYCDEAACQLDHPGHAAAGFSLPARLIGYTEALPGQPEMKSSSVTRARNSAINYSVITLSLATGADILYIVLHLW